jgi:hypothetical protein
VRYRRDELGRFAEKVVPRRDPQGRFAEKVVPRRDPQGRFAAKRVTSRKVAPKAAPRKVEPRKVVPKKVVPKKVEPRKVEPRKVVFKKAAPGKAAPKKKVAPKKVAPKRKVAPKKKVAPKRKVAPKKKVVPKRKVAPKKKVAPKRKVAPKKVVPKRKARRRRKKILPGVSARALQAEVEILSKLTGLMELLASMVPGVGVAVKSFVNSDGSVDGELKVADLPDDMRSEDGSAEIASLLSEVFRSFRPFSATPAVGGKFWVSFAMRFGPQDETEVGKLVELYKKYRGLYQVETYPAAAWHPTPIQLALTTGLKTIVESVARKQGFPPSVILIRFTWTPDGKRPGRLQGTAGSK